MGLFSFLFGSKKQTESIDYLNQNMMIDGQKTINNYPITKINPESVYPWADKIVFNNEITIGNVIMLWWFNKYWNRDRNVPLYFERNYVKNFQIEQEKLVTLGYIEQSGKLTDLGQKALSENHKYVDLHRNNWTTPEESAKNSELNFEQMENMAKQDELWGMPGQAKRLRQQISDDKEYDKISGPYFNAIKLSKQGDPQKSLDILIPLLPKAKGKNRFLRALITERIAIDSRKIKQYEQEIHYLNNYITSEKGQYRYDEFKDKFLKRIDKATQLMRK